MAERQAGQKPRRRAHRPAEAPGGAEGAAEAEAPPSGLRDQRAREARPCVLELGPGGMRVLWEPPPAPSHADSPAAASTGLFSVWIPGTPRPKQSGRIARDKRGRVRFITHTTANGPAGIWHRRIVTMAREAAGEAEWQAKGAKAGLWVRLRFVFSTPCRERWGRAHTMRPDADNLAKLALDALSAAGCLGDDAKAARLDVSKEWGEAAGMGAELRAFYGEREPGNPDPPGRPDWFEDNSDGLPDWLRAAAGPSLGEIDGEDA